MRNLKLLKDLIPSILKESEIPGLSLALVKDGEVIYTEGLGFKSINSKSKIDTKTLFSIGSATKSFTALSLVLLEQKGLIKLNDPVINYYTDFELMNDELSNKLTFKDILIHNSGIPRHDWYWTGSNKSREELVQGMKYLVPWEKFRKSYQYNNLMYMLAGYLVEQITGDSWETFIEKNIFEPLGMNSSGFYNLHKKKLNRALPHRKKNGKVEIHKEISFDAIGPAGSIVSNVHDIANWISFHINKGKYEDHQILKKSMFRKLITPYIKADPTLSKDFKEFDQEFYGLGWRIHNYRKNKIHWHSGGTEGFRSFIGILPDSNAGVVVLGNSGSSVGRDNGVFITAKVALDILLNKKPLDWKKKYSKV